MKKLLGVQRQLTFYDNSIKIWENNEIIASIDTDKVSPTILKTFVEIFGYRYWEVKALMEEK